VLTQDLMEIATRKMETIFHQGDTDPPSQIIAELVGSLTNKFKLGPIEIVQLEMYLLRIVVDA